MNFHICFLCTPDRDTAKCDDDVFGGVLLGRAGKLSLQPRSSFGILLVLAIRARLTPGPLRVQSRRKHRYLADSALDLVDSGGAGVGVPLPGAAADSLLGSDYPLLRFG